MADVEAIYGGARYHFVHGDICDIPLVESLLDGSYFGSNSPSQSLAPEIIVNFAAETHVDRSIDDPAAFIRTNILGTSILLEAARFQWNEAGHFRGLGVGEVPRRLFLQVSTDEVYGCLGEEGRFTESSPLRPNSPYAASKASADLLVRAYHETYRLPAIITRSCNNYGPFQFPEKFIPLMIGRALTESPLPVYGDGRNVREWLHVEDHCAAIACVLEHGKIGQVYNIGSGVERRNLEVVELILRLLNKPKSLITFVEDRPGHDWRYSLDFGPISRLGWQAKVPFEKGLEQTLKWYVEHPDSLEGRPDPVLDHSRG